MKLGLPTEDEAVENLIKNPYNYAAIYARESNSNAPNAIETQIYTCRNYARNNGLLISGIYHEFISAAQVPYKARRQFMKLVEDAKKGCFKKVIVTRRDRLTRRFEEFVEIKKIFKKLNVEVLYSNDIQVNEGKDYACNFVENVIMALAEMEPRRISERTKAGRNAKILKGIYDKRPPFGLRYDKREKQYYHDGVKTEIVTDIFNIYLTHKSVKKPKHVIKALINQAESKVEHQKEYNELVKELDENLIRNILSRLIYAGLQPRDIQYKYKDFYIDFNGESLKVEQEYFHECCNIERIITAKQWYDTVHKWYLHNPKKDTFRKKQNREIVIFKDLFVCKKCNKKLKYRDGKFTCGTAGCKKISKDILIRNVITDLVKWLVYNDRIDDVLDDVIKKLNNEIQKLQKKLTDSINNRTKLLEEYLRDTSNERLKKQIIEIEKEHKVIKLEIDEFYNKINFLNDKLKKIIIPLVESNFIHMIEDELEKNQAALLEIFMYENIKELKINGQSIAIRQKSNKE